MSKNGCKKALQKANAVSARRSACRAVQRVCLKFTNVLHRCACIAHDQLISSNVRMFVCMYRVAACRCTIPGMGRGACIISAARKQQRLTGGIFESAPASTCRQPHRSSEVAAAMRPFTVIFFDKAVCAGACGGCSSMLITAGSFGGQHSQAHPACTAAAQQCSRQEAGQVRS
jgi:hypothetical protein